MNENKQNINQKRQAHFNWVLPTIAGAGGIFAGWKLFGSKSDDDDSSESNPVAYYALIAVFVIVILLVAFFAFRKISKL
jgi:hypothetical protein